MRVLEVGSDGRADVINSDGAQVAVPMYAVNQGSAEPEVLDDTATADLAFHQTIIDAADVATITVPDGTLEGLCKVFTNASSNTAQIEPTTARWGSDIVDLPGAGDFALLQWTSSGWVLLERSPSATTNRS